MTQYDLQRMMDNSKQTTFNFILTFIRITNIENVLTLRIFIQSMLKQHF